MSDEIDYKKEISKRETKIKNIDSKIAKRTSEIEQLEDEKSKEKEKQRELVAAWSQQLESAK